MNPIWLVFAPLVGVLIGAVWAGIGTVIFRVVDGYWPSGEDVDDVFFYGFMFILISFVGGVVMIALASVVGRT